MRSIAITALGVVSLAFAATLDFLVDIPRNLAATAFPMTPLRIWLASLTLVVYVAGNFAYFRLALKKPYRAKWAAIFVLLLGTAGVLYLPLWSLGLPGVSKLLSVRWNPLTSVISRGGLISLLRLQCAALLVLGTATLLTKQETASVQ